MLVVDAPPFMEKRPLVIVEDALEMKPLPREMRPACENAPDTESEPAIAAEFADRTPKAADVEYKFVELAVVAKRFVEVAFPADRSVVETPVAETELPEKELPVMVALEMEVPLNWSILLVWAMTW